METNVPLGRSLHLHTDDDLAGFGELDRIPHEIHQDLTDSARIAHHRGGNIRVHLIDQLEPLLVSAEGQRLYRPVQRSPQIEVDRLQIQPACLDLGEVQDVVQQPEQGIGGFLDREEELPLFRGELGVQSQLRHPDDAVHRCANLVAHIGQKLALGPIRHLGLVSGAHQGRLRLLSLGNVAEDAHEPLPSAASHFADRQVHRKGRAVLASADDLAADPDYLGLPRMRIVAEVAVVLAVIRLRHQHPHVSADDLLRSVPE